jgi:hypothetical protein
VFFFLFFFFFNYFFFLPFVPAKVEWYREYAASLSVSDDEEYIPRQRTLSRASSVCTSKLIYIYVKLVKHVKHVPICRPSYAYYIKKTHAHVVEEHHKHTSIF